ncbi:hypothetical protein CNYM01_13431 [Colletotrichum nymphaeae SA-01]|uniref:ZZ-type domain-containing protein n=1 Tax=Colletotrichum nymphaeae SA-01 TaxID=1460502 RepID=A0A135UXS1_9PEZI|nr:hypothetical protein CNYM01_13431 [Colletotrichum nymphaeae SA-01]
MSTYAYKTLPDPRKYMRLLKLLPASETEPDNLRAEVILCLRKEAPPYKPLSYTWGQQDASCSIWLRDTEDSVWKPFSIRPNLESCLKQLREEVQEAQVLWVDAICINQLNNVEKGHQVGTMDLVYRSQRLIIWLGDSSENSDLAIDLVHSFRDFLNANKHEGSATLSMQDGQGIVARFMETQTDETWAAFIDLIKRPWFTRRWVVQEVVLSTHKHAYLGSRNLCFNYLALFCEILQNQPYHLRQGPPVDDICQIAVVDGHGTRVHPAPTVNPLDAVLRLWNTYLVVDGGGKCTLTLEKLLDNFSAFISFDARDGIYAFISMASDVDTEEWMPDYSDQATTSELYAKATLHIIRNAFNLDILCRRIHDRPFSLSVDHPSSWIPWYGLQNIRFEPGHEHQFHGYNTRSLTTFGQPLPTLSSTPEGPDPKPCVHCKRGGSCRQRACNACGRRIPGTGYRCSDCEGFDLCSECIDIRASDHNPTHRFKKQNNAVYFASSRSISVAPEYPPIRCGCSSSSHLLPLPVKAFFVDTIKSVGMGGTVRHHFETLAVQLPLEDWKGLEGMSEIGLDSEGNVNAGFLKALTGNFNKVFGIRSI